MECYMPRLAVTIITLNEARDLPDCLRSVSFADDILVVDSGSTDRTVEIAREMGARVIENPWPGFAAQRQFAMERAQGDWCLVLDADERISPELQGAIAVSITKDNVNGYYIPFEMRMFGESLRHGGSCNDRRLRLFRKARARWSQNGCEEDVLVDGATEELKDPIVHIPYASFTEYCDKLNTKSSQRALELHQRGVGASKLRALQKPALFFLRYIVQLGFLDGWIGFLHAVLSTFCEFVTQVKLFDIERQISEHPLDPSQVIPRLATPAQPLDLSGIRTTLPAPSDQEQEHETDVVAEQLESGQGQAPSFEKRKGVA